MFGILTPVSLFFLFLVCPATNLEIRSLLLLNDQTAESLRKKLTTILLFLCLGQKMKLSSDHNVANAMKFL